MMKKKGRDVYAAFKKRNGDGTGGNPYCNCCRHRIDFQNGNYGICKQYLRKFKWINKRGDEFVEAAMVLPLLILTVLSLILLLIFFFSCLEGQVNMHKNLLRENEESVKVFDLAKNELETSSEIGGLAEVMMHKKVTGRIYRINAADVIRAGEMLGFDEE